MRATGSTNSSSNAVSLTVTVVLLAVSAGLYYLKVIGVPLLVILVIISLLIGNSIKIADQWEKAVVLRMGKFSGLKGPGLFLIIPIIDQISSFIDQRVTGHGVQGGTNPYKRHCPGKCRRSCLLDRLGCGKSCT